MPTRLRRTGSTQQMLIEALARVMDHKEVRIITASVSHTNTLRNQLKQLITSYQLVENPKQIKFMVYDPDYINLSTGMLSRGGIYDIPENVTVLIDHYTLEVHMPWAIQQYIKYCKFSEEKQDIEYVIQEKELYNNISRLGKLKHIT